MFRLQKIKLQTIRSGNVPAFLRMIVLITVFNFCIVTILKYWYVPCNIIMKYYFVNLFFNLLVQLKYLGHSSAKCSHCNNEATNILVWKCVCIPTNDCTFWRQKNQPLYQPVCEYFSFCLRIEPTYHCGLFVSICAMTDESKNILLPNIEYATLFKYSESSG